METKTLKEWIDTLPEPQRSRALANTEERLTTLKSSSLKDTVTIAFVWIDTPEGWDYWYAVSEGEEPPPPLLGTKFNAIKCAHADLVGSYQDYLDFRGHDWEAHLQSIKELEREFNFLPPTNFE